MSSLSLSGLMLLGDPGESLIPISLYHALLRQQFSPAHPHKKKKCTHFNFIKREAPIFLAAL